MYKSSFLGFVFCNHYNLNSAVSEQDLHILPQSRKSMGTVHPTYCNCPAIINSFPIPKSKVGHSNNIWDKLLGRSFWAYAWGTIYSVVLCLFSSSFFPEVLSCWLGKEPLLQLSESWQFCARGTDSNSNQMILWFNAHCVALISCMCSSH